VHLDLLTVGKEENGAALLLPKHLKECGSPEAEEPVYRAGGRDAQLAYMTHLGLAVDLDQYVPLEDAEDLVGIVVAMEVSNVVGRHRLDAHNESMQAVLRAGDDAKFAGSHRERHSFETGSLSITEAPTAFRQPPGALQFGRSRAMDTEHVRSGAALEGRPAHRHNPGGDKSSGVDGEVAAPAPQSQRDFRFKGSGTGEDAERFIEEVRGNDPELERHLRVEERELEAAWG
jgi:hypothetical protein